MAEQISHKRSLRVKRLDEDKKRLLKEYYKLSDDTEGSIEDETTDSVANTPTIAAAEVSTNKLNMDSPVNETEEVTTTVKGPTTKPERKINEMTLQEILQIHNRLVGQEIEMSNSIKNTIYDNYYDLVKVNTLLEGLVNPDTTIQTKLNKDNRFETLLEQLRALNEP
ncbi:hypothetical protein C6P45_003813 [Maudiozyma exigua]|uniref:Vacuolar protein sorting-associated protein 51 homolog n=1 Tax=Maudiozyma exigua TaxID=34358 RepID=A0A9P6WCJ6_MAUEX|nr:hypothetical protein C6P45_003813 [Kazachstania exigua]